MSRSQSLPSSEGPISTTYRYNAGAGTRIFDSAAIRVTLGIYKDELALDISRHMGLALEPIEKTTWAKKWLTDFFV